MLIVSKTPKEQGIPEVIRNRCMKISVFPVIKACQRGYLVSCKVEYDR